MGISGTLIAMSLAALFPATILYVANVFIANARLTLIAHGVTLVGWLLLTCGLVMRASSEGLPALSTGIQALMAIASALLLVHLVQAVRWNLPSFGAFVSPFALAALFVATALPSTNPAYDREILASQWIYLHVLTIALSMVLLSIAASCALLWLAQHHLLKAKKWAGAFHRLPPLEVLDSLSFFFAAVGFAALTLGVITAVVWAVTHPEQPQVQNILTRLAGTFSWLLYAFYLWAHTNARWRGRRAQYVLVAGCVAILLTTSLHRWFTPNPGAISHPAAHSTAAGAVRS